MDPLDCHECGVTGLTRAIRLDKCHHVFCLTCQKRLSVTEQIHNGQLFCNHYRCSVCNLYCKLESTTQLQDFRWSPNFYGSYSRRRNEEHSSTKYGELPYRTSTELPETSTKHPEINKLSQESEIMGLQNTKLTCAVNAVVQVLAQTPGFLEALFEFGGKCRQEAFLANEVINCIADVNNVSGACIINAENIQKEMIKRRNDFHFWRQHDCFSFLLNLLEALEEEIGNDSMNLFTGQMRNRFTYENCKHTEHSSLQSFRSLCIPMNKAESSVENNLKMLFQAESLEDSGIYCQSCRKAKTKMPNLDTCSKELVIEETPKILVLQLAKFKEVKDIYGRTILEKRQIPMPYSNTLQLQEGATHFLVKYKLFAVISHQGSIKGGHYVSYVQTIQNQNQRDCVERGAHDRRPNTWYHCTDSVVTRLEPKAGYPTCPDAYILFYHKLS